MLAAVKIAETSFRKALGDSFGFARDRLNLKGIR